VVDKFMLLALEEAKKAEQEEEIPVGAVIVCNGEVVASTHNKRESLHDATAHAEILAIREAGRKRKDWRLTGCTIYVTLEPCPMCASAIVLSRISKIVFGAYDYENGACGSKINIPVSLPIFGYRAEVLGGVMADECRGILQEFFKKRRNLYNRERRDG
jgi:tRNA(adenine34) deaminase